VLDEHERERVELAHELHEQIAQSLAVVLLGLDDPALCDASDAQAYKIIALREQVAQTLEHCTALAVGLRPPVLDHLGLAPALEQLAQRVGVERVSVDPALAQVALGPVLETEVYRSVEHMLGSVDADRGVAVSAGATGDHLIVSVLLLDPEAPIPDLDPLKLRLELVGGTVTARGRELLIRVPLEIEIDSGVAAFPQPSRVNIPDGERRALP